MSPIEMVKVKKSRTIDSFGYRKNIELLYVRFKVKGLTIEDKGLYCYSDVPDIIYKRLLEEVQCEGSIGSFISQNVVKVYRYEKIVEANQ